MIRILWVDDQVHVAKSFSTILESTGAIVEFACDGAEALEKISTGSYDLILTDLAMPPGRWGGLWLLDELKKRANTTAVIVVSGEGSQSETIQALRLGAADYVTKEELSNELPQQIIAVLEASSRKRHDLMSLIASGENERLEFKSTLRFNLHAKRVDSNIELAVFKTIAGFLNASGGDLLIGVDDSGKIVGIAPDGFDNIDKFQLHFWNIVRDALGAELSEFLQTTVHTFDEGVVFLVSCKASNRPIFLKWKGSGESKHQEHFYVRAGPQTELLGTRQAIAYIRDHFGH